MRVRLGPSLPGGPPPPPGTHVMTAVSSRKAWAVTSHLTFFTATFCPRYSPCRTAVAGVGGGGTGAGTGRWKHPRTPTAMHTARAVGPQAWKTPHPCRLIKDNQLSRVCKLQLVGQIQAGLLPLQGSQSSEWFAHFFTFEKTHKKNTTLQQMKMTRNSQFSVHK